MKIKIVPSSELTAKSLSPHHYIRDAHYYPERPTTFKVRDWNSVLDEADWPVLSVTVQEERTIGLRVLSMGVCSLPSFTLGQSLQSLLEWLLYDGTGEHPEHEHQILNPRNGKWERIGGMEDLKAILSECSRRKAGRLHR
jgi:hypothetical protein